MKLKAFISWSGDDSRAIAEALRDWIPLVLQRVQPWVSSGDIEAGARWNLEIATELEASKFGIICMTPQNLNRPWILFEAGALGKTLDSTFVCPYLHNLDIAQLPAPLAQFHGASADKKGTWQLVLTLNQSLGKHGLPAEHLRKVFRRLWPLLAKTLESVRGHGEQRDASELEVIRDPLPRTKRIVRDLETLGELSDTEVSRQFVRYSGFLSAFGIGKKEEFTSKEKKYRRQLLKEKACLLGLARRGCVVRCIITPPVEYGFFPFRIEHLIRRMQTLIKFLKSKDRWHDSIEWAISPSLQKDTYIIGTTSSFQGLKKARQRGYYFTLRQSGLDAVSANTSVYDTLFEHLKTFTLTTYSNREESDSREALRRATLNCLKKSLKLCLAEEKKRKDRGKKRRGRKGSEK